jgi:hypothetical protein
MALAASTTAPRDPERQRGFRALAQHDTRVLLKEGVDYGRALAHRLETLDAWLQGQTEAALQSAILAEMAFESCDMALHANVMKRFRGLLRGPSGRELVQAADAWMEQQGIVDTGRMTAMYLPGMRRDSD